MKKLLLLLSLITLSYAGVGKITAIRGDALIISSNGNSTKAIVNQELEESDIIKTENNARLQIIFNDNTVTTLGKNTTLEIKQYIVDGKNSKANLEVKEGSFKVITGEISKLARKNFTLKTQTATIGIRGTIFIGEISESVNKLACLQGAIDVKVGDKISLINAGKQVVFKNNRISHIEPLNIKDFNIEEKIENNNANDETTQQESNKNSNTSSNKVKSVVLGSSLNNSNSKESVDNLEQNKVSLKTKEKVDDIIANNVLPITPPVDNNNGNNNNNNNNNTPVTPVPPTDNGNNGNTPTIPVDPTPDPIPVPNPDPVPPTDNGNNGNTPTIPVPNPDPVPTPDPTPVPDPVPDPNDKYFKTNDNKTYYYSNMGGTRQSAAKLDLGVKQIVLYDKVLDNNDISEFREYTIDNSRKEIKMKRYDDKEYFTKTYIATDGGFSQFENNPLDVTMTLNEVSSSPSNIVRLQADKTKLTGNIYDNTSKTNPKGMLNLDLNAGNNVDFNKLNQDWNEFFANLMITRATSKPVYYINGNNFAKLFINNEGKSQLEYYGVTSVQNGGRPQKIIKKVFINNNKKIVQTYNADNETYTKNMTALNNANYKEEIGKFAGSFNSSTNGERVEYSANKNSLVLNKTAIDSSEEEKLLGSNENEFNAKKTEWENIQKDTFNKIYGLGDYAITKPKTFYYTGGNNIKGNTHVKLAPSESKLSVLHEKDTEKILMILDKQKLSGKFVDKNTIKTQFSEPIKEKEIIKTDLDNAKIDIQGSTNTNKLKFSGDYDSADIEGRVLINGIKHEFDNKVKSVTNGSSIDNKINNF